MKKFVLTGIREMGQVVADEPQIIHGNEVKIKIATVGVCGSDIHYYAEGKIGTQVVNYPFAVGHECSGYVVEIGNLVTHLNIGDLVVIDPSIHCGKCDQCLKGRPHTCRENRFLGCPGQIEGCLAEYIVMPDYACFPVTGKMNPVQAALIEPFSIGVYSVRQASPLNSDSVAIFGAGPIGLSILFKLLADGISNIGVIEPLGYRLKLAGEIGARYLIDPGRENAEETVKQNEKELVDIVFEASGKQQAVDNALKILKPGGKLVLVGIPPDAKYTFDMDMARRKEITLINIRRQNHCVEEAIELVISGEADIEKMVSHHFPFEDTPIAFDIVDGYKNGAVKVMIDL